MKARQTILPAAEFRRQLECAVNRASTTLRELGYLCEEGRVYRETAAKYNHLTMTLEVHHDRDDGVWLLRYSKPNAYSIFGTWYLGGTRGFPTREAALDIASKWHAANPDWYEVFEYVDADAQDGRYACAAE